MNKFRLINYFDVLGNYKDGYEINNQCVEFDDLYIDDSATPKDILKYLKSISFLNTDDLRKLVIEDMGERIEIYQRKEMFPICCLELIVQ